MTTDAGATGAGASPAWEARADEAETAPDGFADRAAVALVCAAHGAAPGVICTVPHGGTVQIADASGRIVWSGPRSACPDLSAEAALDLLAGLLPGWRHAVDEHETDGLAEVELRGPDGLDDPVRAVGRTIALGLTAALCRAMGRAGGSGSASDPRHRPALDAPASARCTAAAPDGPVEGS